MSHMARRLFLPSLLLPLAWLAAGAPSALAQSPSPSLAQPAAAPAAGTTPARPSPELVAPPPPPTRGVRSEPAVQRSVIEDDNARIEELRVRGADTREPHAGATGCQGVATRSRRACSG